MIFIAFKGLGPGILAASVQTFFFPLSFPNSEFKPVTKPVSTSHLILKMGIIFAL